VKSRCEASGESAGAVSRRRWLAAAAGACVWPGMVSAQGSGGRLDRIRERGSLVVGMYQEMPPFHVDGRGIDVELGRALAQAMDLKFSALPFQAGENMNDDLRNMVWKGHYLGWGPADVLLHVPVDRQLTQANPQVQVVAPYYRERVLLALDKRKLGKADSLADLQGLSVAVAGQSLPGWLLAGAEGGVLQAHLTTAFPDGAAAAKALLDGKADAASGLASELEAVLAGDPRFSLQPLPSPRAPRDGWAIGCAVRQDAGELAAALQQGMQTLQASGRLQAIFAAEHVSWHL
jgi:ABC-type amino acid transport substrate-binding protein